MATVVIGGHSRNIGKTSVVCALIAALPARRWTAIKITQFGHGVCSANGEPCDCTTADHTLAVSEERDPASGTDSSRYLAAGAVRSLWVRTRQGELASAMRRIRSEIARSDDVVLESNSVLRFLQPDLFASVLDPHVPDFKPSALRYLDRADAILVPEGTEFRPAWAGVSARMLAKIPRYSIAPPDYASSDFAGFVAQRLDRLNRSHDQAGIDALRQGRA
jgi:molybdopterin-guanine dinucleotide biosynthesis protein